MKKVEFRMPKKYDVNRTEALIERVCADRGLRLGMKGTLASYPGCVHWHFKKSQEKGTLEITLYATGRRIWAQVQDGRKAQWIDKELPALQRAIEQELRR